MSDCEFLPPEFVNLCLHCKARPAVKHRGLCRQCYESDIREGYDPLRDTGNRFEFPDTKKQRPIPSIPTNTQPSSEERILVYILRASMYLALHSAKDRKLPANARDAMREDKK